MLKTYPVALLLLIALVLSSGLRPLVVLGTSMAPALRPWQVVLLDSHHYRDHPLEREQIVAFRWKGNAYVKRVYALAGETVRLACNQGYCSPISPGYEDLSQRTRTRYAHFELRDVVVPPGHFYCLGDFGQTSVDSRELGPIPNRALLGRVFPLGGAAPASSPVIPKHWRLAGFLLIGGLGLLALRLAFRHPR